MLLLATARPSFLLLTPSCVLLGLATAAGSGAQVDYAHFALILAGFIAAHASVNAFNEYFDFRSGLDGRTSRTPFSGGSGTLPQNPEFARATLVMAWSSFGVTALTGMFFSLLRGPALLPLFALGLLIILAYTPWVTRRPLLCLLAPGIGFGPLMVCGTHFALAGHYSWPSLAASLVPFFLVSNLLLLNQFPDVQADRSVGRRHLPIVLGAPGSGKVYVAWLGLCYLSIVLSVVSGLLPVPALAGLLTLALAVPAARLVLAHSEEIPRIIPAMGMNVMINLLTPALMAGAMLAPIAWSHPWFF